jgi:hypothetical protein
MLQRRFVQNECDLTIKITMLIQLMLLWKDQSLRKNAMQMQNNSFMPEGCTSTANQDKDRERKGVYASANGKKRISDSAGIAEVETIKASRQRS